MSSASRGALGLVVGVTLTAVACGLWPTFPDDQLHPGGGMDGGTSDGGLSDGAVPDAVPDATAPGDGGMDGAVPDGSLSDGATDAPSAPDAGLACDMIPHSMVSSRVVASAIPGAQDFAFDGTGRVAVGFGTEVDLVAPGGVRTMLVSSLPGTVVALRYAPTGDLVMALASGTTDAGAPAGIIAAVSRDGSGLRTLATDVARPGGLAVDPGGHVWFSNGVTGEVTRLLLGATVGRPAVIFHDVPGPTAMAFDVAGTTLYVASAMAGQMATVYKVSLMAGDMDTVTPTMPATPYAGGLTSPDGVVTGLVLDQCGYLYAADSSRNQIWRVDPPPGSDFVRLVTDTPMPRGLAFGQGGMYDGRTIFTLDSDGSLRAAGVVALGVPRPTPP